MASTLSIDGLRPSIAGREHFKSLALDRATLQVNAGPVILDAGRAHLRVGPCGQQWLDIATLPKRCPALKPKCSNNAIIEEKT